MRSRVLFLLALAAGCSGLKSYPTDPGGNLAVTAEMQGNVRAALHVHRVAAGCGTRSGRTEYAGTLALDRPASLGLPTGETSYLVVEFDTSSFLGGSRSTSVGTLVTPRPGSRYELAARYRDGIYDVALYESDPRTRSRRALPRRELGACRD